MENIFPQKRELSGDGKYWKKEADIAREKVKELEERNKVLEDALKDAITRMDRARNILKRDGNWGMLDTSELKEALSNNQ